ncbi:MAG TPA: TetR/AcrR family transcriptional regulator [Polyangiaceae bacterium]|jgi:TetR/AcrR family fatty acid metabolism transcriptional regulator
MSYAAYLAAPERRRRILETAKGVFARRGYHDTNISHICEALGIARGTLYQYFTSKKDVFAAIVEEMLTRVREAVAREPVVKLPPGFRPTREQVLEYTSSSLQRILEAVFADAASLRILVREAVGLDVGIDAIVHKIDALVIDRFASDLEAARSAGIIRADVDPRAAALFVLGGVQKVALDALGRNDDAIDLGALAARVTRMNMLGLLSEEVH